MTGTAEQFTGRAEACELASAHLRTLAKKDKVKARELLYIAQWIERRGFWYMKKLPAVAKP